MNQKDTRYKGRLNNPQIEQEILAVQVRQAYALAPFGILATLINSSIVLYIMKDVIPHRPLFVWFALIVVLSTIRIWDVLRFGTIARRRPPAHAARLFLAGLVLIGLVWGSVGLFPFTMISLGHEVFIAFVLGGMAAGAATSFAVLKGGYLAYSVPALLPIVIRFLLINTSFHDAMAAMLILYGFLLWRISGHHYRANRTSLLLRYENRDMIDRLKRAEAELRGHQKHLEKTVQERTTELITANEKLKTEIEERKRIEHALRESNERLALAQKAGRAGVFDWDMVSGKLYWTEQLEELFGLRPGGFEGDYQGWIKRVHPEDRPWIEAQFRKWRSERREEVEFEYRFIHAGGQTRWMTVRAKISYSGDGTPVRMIGTKVDSTERKRLEHEIMHMVHHDTLTGLPNRRLFMDIINIEAAQARRNRRKFAVLFLDIDRFKDINDTFGHDAGDELLKEVSRRVRSGIRESDALARIGGDEFNIILSDIARPEDITLIAQKIMGSFKEPFLIEGYRLRVTTSIGISIYPDDSEDIHTLFRFADIAMYHAKERGRNVFQFYDPEINIQSIERLKFENYLRQTIARGELAVHYQPQIEISTGRLVAAEALVRWTHPQLGTLESKQFVPVAESIGLITAIDEWVLKTACAQFKAWIDAGYDHLCIAVNLSSRIFQNENFVEIISGILDETGLPPDRLEVEITETVAMHDIEHTIVLLKELSRRGIGIAIDDFGTGYSSLNYLKKLPIHRLKIDQSFIKDIASDPDDRAIIMAVTAMAHNMKLSVIAEGVETEEQLSFLSEAHCDEAQGYFLNKPLPAEKFAELIAAR